MCWFYCRKCNATGLRYTDLHFERTSRDRCPKCNGFGYKYITDIDSVDKLISLQQVLNDEWSVTPEKWQKLEEQERNQFTKKERVSEPAPQK